MRRWKPVGMPFVVIQSESLWTIDGTWHEPRRINGSSKSFDPDRD